MANYTQSIREILQFNKTAQESLTDISDVYAIASRSFFDVDGINAISSDYRQKLITGFALHFMNDEIGYETLPLWKIALNDKLYNYGTYINQIFENLDKEVFAEYHVRQVLTDGTSSGSKTGTGSVVTDKDISTSDGGTETREYEGSEVSINSGTDVRTDNGYQDNIASSASGNYTNGVQITSDTPMGSLQNIRTPGGDVDDNTSQSVEFDEGRDLDVYEFGGDRGYDYTTGQTYNYMSGAMETDQTVTNVENSNDKSINSNQSSTQHGLVTATTYGVDGEGVADDRKDTITKSNTTTVADDTTQTTSNSETTSDTHEDETNETDYSLNWEMLYKSMPLMNKIFEVFDDLFMLIY